MTLQTLTNESRQRGEYEIHVDIHSITPFEYQICEECIHGLVPISKAHISQIAWERHHASSYNT